MTKLYLQNDTNCIKTLASGHLVTLAEEFYDHNRMLFVKDYRLNGYPMNAKGELLVDLPWYQYAEWLEAYLYAAEIELRPDEEQLRRHYLSKPPSGIMIGTHCGLFEGIRAMQSCYAYIFPDDFEKYPQFNGLETVNSDDPYKMYLEYMEDVGDGEEPLTREQYVLQEYGWQLINQMEQEEFDVYWPQFSKISGLTIMGIGGPYTEPADAGWRVQLSLALKTIPAKTERVQLIDKFMDEFCNYLHK